MTDASLIDLEMRIKELPGVLGCVILSSGGGPPYEVQAFSRVGLQPEVLEGLIQAEIDRAGLANGLSDIHVFELDAESFFGDRESLQRAAEVAEQEARSRGPISLDGGGHKHEQSAPSSRSALDSRPVLQRVILTSSSGRAEAEVSLQGAREVVGSAQGEKTAYGLAVVAEATLKACSALVSHLEVELRGASLVSVVGEQAVIVLVRLGEEQDLLGCALLRNGPATDAAVRATLDAVNRVLTYSE